MYYETKITFIVRISTLVKRILSGKTVSSCRPCKSLALFCTSKDIVTHAIKNAICRSIEKKKKIPIEIHIVVTFTHVYTNIYHNCVTVLQHIKYQWNKTRLLFYSTYVYILYRHWKHAVSRVVLANKDFATKTK